MFIILLITYSLYNYYTYILYIYAATAAKSLQSCPTLCDPIDGSPPGSPIPGILQARTLEWVAISSSRDLSDPGIEPESFVLQADSLLVPPGKPNGYIK